MSRIDDLLEEAIRMQLGELPKPKYPQKWWRWVEERARPTASVIDDNGNALPIEWYGGYPGYFIAVVEYMKDRSPTYHGEDKGSGQLWHRSEFAKVVSRHRMTRITQENT